MSNKRVPSYFRLIIQDELIPDVIFIFEEFSDETLLEICKGNYLGLFTSGQLSKTGALHPGLYR